MMNDRLTHLTRALSFALLCGWAGADMVSAQETQPEALADEAVGAPRHMLPWLRILVEGDRQAADALRDSKLELTLLDSAEDRLDSVTGLVDIPAALRNSEDYASILVDRYPMVLLVDADSYMASRIDYEINGVRLSKADSEGPFELEFEASPQSWRTFDLQSDTEATLVWVVLIKRSQYCPLVDVADVPDCEDFDVSPAGSGEAPDSIADHEAATEEVVRLRPQARPQPVDYTVTISLAFAGSKEGADGRAVSSLRNYCEIVFMPSGDAEAVVGEVEYSATPPAINATLRALTDAPIDLTGANLRFDTKAEASRDCVYDGAVVALDGMSQDQTMIAGVVVLPPQEPRFELFYDLSGQVIGNDERDSGEAVMGFATRVANVLGARLANGNVSYGVLVDYFAWTPRDSLDPKLEPMSELDTEGSSTPSGREYLQALNESVRTQMLNLIGESVRGVSPSQIAALLDQARPSFSTLLDVGDSSARDPNLRVFVQVADTARAACIDASRVEAAPYADIRRTRVKRIVAVAEPLLSFDTEWAVETQDSLIWRCRPTEDSSVDTWLVPLSDVARDNDWQALTAQIGNLNRQLVP